MCFKNLFKKTILVSVEPEVPSELEENPKATGPQSPARKKGVIMLVKDPTTQQEFNVKSEKVDVLNLRPETKMVAVWVASLITNEAGAESVITNAKRSVEEQKAAMEKLKKNFGQDYYDRVYGRWERLGGKVEELPHVEGRAVDFRYDGFQKAIPALQVLNDTYLGRAHFVLGYTPSSLVVIEKDNCFHIQTARGITDQNRQAYIDFVKTITLKA